MDNTIKFLMTMGNLKKIPRTGWLLRNIYGCETVAAHNHRVALICMLLCDRIDNVDFETTLKMALLHEIGETRLGDIPTPVGKKFNKDRVEKKIAEEILVDCKLQRYQPLTDEYFDGDSIEKIIVDAADKIDMMLQAYEYSKNGFSGAKEFFNKIDDFIDKYTEIDEIKKIFVEIKNEIDKETDF